MPVIRRIRRNSYSEQDQETDGNMHRDSEGEPGYGVHQKEKQPPAGSNDDEENDADEEGVHAHHGHRHDLLEEVGISTEDAFVGYTADRAVSINVWFLFIHSPSIHLSIHPLTLRLLCTI